ncbi:hemolysin family protein [Persicimonas caeni]|uniref:hemolysin family protein n=1 Tax=Persicimonas caeni TaxID=2292766 RepID=UPI00143CFF04|nr:hemolysin family protein [Persicimonas caeni]
MESVLPEVVGLLLCLLGSAWFSATETALTSLSESQARKLAEEKSSLALRIWRRRPFRVLTALLIANTLVNLTAAALATHAALDLLEGADIRWIIAAAVGVSMLLVLTIGEVSPKTLGKRSAHKIARPLMTAFLLPYLLLYPITFVFTKMARGVVSVFGSSSAQAEPFVTAEDIEYMIDLGAREGSFSEDRERLLRSVFEFSDTLVRELMVPRTDIVSISMDMNLQEIIETLVACGHSRLPVYEGNVDEIVGLFYAKDVLAVMASGRTEKFHVRDYLRRPYFVPETKRVAELLSEFQSERMHMAIVVDEFGGTSGLITLEDIIEEIFGDIQDEYDVEPSQMVPLGAHSVRADARVPIDEIEEYFTLELPEHPDYESLGGFLMSQAGGVPEPGHEVLWEGLRFRVLDADPKRVITVLIEQLSDADLEREELVG